MVKKLPAIPAEFTALNTTPMKIISCLVVVGTIRYKYGTIDYQTRKSILLKQLKSNRSEQKSQTNIIKQSYIYGPHICGDSIDIDSNHNHLLTGSWRKGSTLQIWDLRNFELIRDVFKNKSTQMVKIKLFTISYKKIL